MEGRERLSAADSGNAVLDAAACHRCLEPDVLLQPCWLGRLHTLEQQSHLSFCYPQMMCKVEGKRLKFHAMSSLEKKSCKDNKSSSPILQNNINNLTCHNDAIILLLTYS